jgi:putative endonuclease
MRDHDYWTYIVTNKLCTTLYIGVTNDLWRRMSEHRAGEVKGFTQRHSLNRLLWFEHFREVGSAIACEKKLKGWLRSRKVALIEKENPRWMDLSADWFTQMPAIEYRGAELVEGIVGDSSLRSE